MKKLNRFFGFAVLALIIIQCKTPSIVATKSMMDGNHANNRSDYPNAIIFYEQYLTASRQLGLYRDQTEEARVCRSLAHAYATQGKFNQSKHYLTLAANKDSVLSNALDLTEDYRELGEVYAFKGDYDESLKFLTKSLNRSQGLETSIRDAERNSVAATNLSLAQVNLSMGNYNDAERYSHKAFALYASGAPDPAGQSEAKLLLGIIAREKNNPQSAETQLQETLALCKAYNYNSSRQNQALSEVYWLKGDIENTIRYKLIALEEAKKTNIKPQILIATMRMGDVYQKLGDQKKASVYYQQAISYESSEDTTFANPSLKIRTGSVKTVRHSYSRSGSGLGKALVSLRLGDLYREKNPDSAAYFFLQAHQLFEKMGSPEGIANAEFQLAKVCLERQQYTKAKILLKDAAKLTIQPDLQWQLALRTGMVDEAQGKIDSARLEYEKAIGIIDVMRGNLTVEEFKTLFANTKVEVYDRMIQLLLKNKARFINQKIPVVETTFYLAEQSRSRAFLDLMGNHRIDAKATTDSVLLEKEQQFRLKIQQVSKELTSASADDARLRLSDALQNVQEEYLQLIQTIKLNNPAYSEMISVSPQKISDLQNALDNKSALLEYWVGEEAAIVWIITRKGINVQVIPVSRKDLVREVQGCRNAIALQAEEMTNKTLSNLYRELILPAVPDLRDINKLIIIPHASLHFLPFQALKPTTSRFLVEDFIISYSPSASVWYSCLSKKPASGERVLAMALGNQSIGEFGGLPGTEMEVKQIGKVYDNHLDEKIGNTFTESYFKEEAAKYNYIHLATHGALNTVQPLYSYLLMFGDEKNDGRLTVDEIFGMDIRGKLITLSACETGLGELGKGDELVGLSRAFMYAGAPAVIVSLWKVEDATTAWLLTRFYQYLNSGQPAPESLSFAQRDLLNYNLKSAKQAIRGLKTVELDQKIIEILKQQKGTISRIPFYWSPFVLMGSSH